LYKVKYSFLFQVLLPAASSRAPIMLACRPLRQSWSRTSRQNTFNPITSGHKT